MSVLSGKALKEIVKELIYLQQTPPEDIQVIPNDEDLTTIEAWIRGPDGTPYEGGYFKVRLELDASYPETPPKGYFITKIFHPNISPVGEICVNTLKKDWKPELGIKNVLLTIKCLLIAPNPESALNEDAGKLLLEQYDDYAKRARLYTCIQAQSGKNEYLQLGSKENKCALTTTPIEKSSSSTVLKPVSNTKRKHDSEQTKSVKKKTLRRL